MLQLGLMPSHLSFRFLQIMQASRLGLGTLELPRAGSGPDPWSARVSAPGSDTIMVSDGEFDDDDDDMLFSAARGRACQHSGRGENGRWLPVDSGQRSVSDRCRGRIINSLPVCIRTPIDSALSGLAPVSGVGARKR